MMIAGLGRQATDTPTISFYAETPHHHRAPIDHQQVEQKKETPDRDAMVFIRVFIEITPLFNNRPFPGILGTSSLFICWQFRVMVEYCALFPR